MESRWSNHLYIYIYHLFVEKFRTFFDLHVFGQFFWLGVEFPSIKKPSTEKSTYEKPSNKKPSIKKPSYKNLVITFFGNKKNPIT